MKGFPALSAGMMPQDQVLTLEAGGCPPERVSLSRTGYDIHSPDDSDEELLRYAIMLSLQGDNEANASGVSTCDLTSGTSTDLASVYRNSSDLSLHNSTINMQPSAILSLPLELKELICALVFTGETIVVKPKRSGGQKFILTWGPHLSLLLASRKTNTIATGYLRSAKVVLDLRQYRNPATGLISSTLALEDLLSDAVNLRSVCSKLLLRQGQSIIYDHFQHLLPSVTDVELYDYKSCREILREGRYYSGRIFEYAVSMMTRPRAAGQLKAFEDSLPSGVYGDLIYVCDTLVCIPAHHSENGNDDDDHITKGSSKESHGCRNREVESCNKGSRYKTAKLRHEILFNRFHPDGLWLRKDWVVAGLGAQSFSLGEMVAVHCHEYCLELIERGETLGV